MSHLKDVCKIGYGEATCRYIAVGSDGIFCAKVKPELVFIKREVDFRVANGTMNAKGDNCEGRHGELTL